MKSGSDHNGEAGQPQARKDKLDDSLDEWYSLADCAPCSRQKHSKRSTCADNPLCLFGLGEVNNGVWAKLPISLSSIEAPANSQLRTPLKLGALTAAQIREADPDVVPAY